MPRREIDPQLPFIQIHRGLEARAARLAQMEGMPHSQAVGGMVVLWMDLSDRRILRKAIARPGGSAVVLSKGELEGKLRLAFGRAVAIESLVLCGLIEPMENGYRIRGMSRQMQVEASRLKIQLTALKNADEKRDQVEITFSLPEGTVGGDPRPAELIGERREEIPKEDLAPDGAGPGSSIEQAFTQVPKDRRKSDWTILTQAICDTFVRVRGEAFPFAQRDGKALSELRKLYPDKLILERWETGLRATNRWQRVSNIGQLKLRWTEIADKDFVPSRPTQSTPEPPSLPFYPNHNEGCDCEGCYRLAHLYDTPTPLKVVK